MSAGLQVMPGLVDFATPSDLEEGTSSMGMVYQIDSVNRTLNKSGPTSESQPTTTSFYHEPTATSQQTQSVKPRLIVEMDELQFRALILDTQVLGSSNYLKWKWDLIYDIVEGPLQNPRRLEEAIRATKFLKRLIAFYRPFKHRFADVRNTKPNQRYVKVGCALIKTLLQNPEGISYLGESKFLRQLGECVAQMDPLSGLTSETPIFAADR